MKNYKLPKKIYFKDEGISISCSKNIQRNLMIEFVKGYNKCREDFIKLNK